MHSVAEEGYKVIEAQNLIDRIERLLKLIPLTSMFSNPSGI